MTVRETASEKKGLGHRVLLLYLYNDEDTLCSLICADYTERKVYAENYTGRLMKTAFGVKEHPSWEDYLEFLEERCIPRQRAGLREYLDVLGLDEYDPLEIIRRTGGRMAEDQQWLRVEDAV